MRMKFLKPDNLRHIRDNIRTQTVSEKNVTENRRSRLVPEILSRPPFWQCL